MATVRVSSVNLTVPGSSNTPKVRVAQVSLTIPGPQSGSTGYQMGYSGGYGAAGQVNITVPTATVTITAPTPTVSVGVSTSAVNILIPTAVVSATAPIPAVGSQIVGTPPITVEIRRSPSGASFDLTPFFKSVTTQIGRTSPLDNTDPAGTATIVFDDSDGVLDPENSGSPLYGWLKPRRTTTVYLYAQLGGGRYYQFTGGIESLERTWPGGQSYSETTMVVVDSIKDMKRGHIIAAGVTRPEELPGARISALLTQESRSGIIYQPRTQLGTVSVVHTGQKMLGPYTFDGNTSTWDVMAQAAASEGGHLYVNAAGQVIFRGQSWSLANNTSSDWVLGDDDGEITYTDDATWRLSDDNFVDDAAVELYDGTSTGIYGGNGFSEYGKFGETTATTDLATQLASMEAAKSYAAHLYNLGSLPRRRVQSVTVDAAVDIGNFGADSAYRLALNADLDDRITLNRRPPNGAQVLSNDYNIVGISHNITDSSWTVTLTLDLAPPTAVYFVLGEAAFGDGSVLTW